MADWSAVSSTVTQETERPPARVGASTSLARASRSCFWRSRCRSRSPACAQPPRARSPSCARGRPSSMRSTRRICSLCAPPIHGRASASGGRRPRRHGVDGSRRRDAMEVGRGVREAGAPGSRARALRELVDERRADGRSAGRCGPPSRDGPRAARSPRRATRRGRRSTAPPSRPPPGGDFAAQPTPALVVRRRRRVRPAPRRRPHERRAAGAPRGAGDRERAGRAAYGDAPATTAPIPGTPADGAIDGTYARRWAGAPGKIALVAPRRSRPSRSPSTACASSSASTRRASPRPGGGRSYAVAWAPLHYTLEASEDGRHFVAVASEPLRADGSILPLRRRLVTLRRAAHRARPAPRDDGRHGRERPARRGGRARRARDRRVPRRRRPPDPRDAVDPERQRQPVGRVAHDARRRDHQRRVPREVPAGPLREAPARAPSRRPLRAIARRATASRSTRPRATRRARSSSRSRATIRCSTRSSSRRAARRPSRCSAGRTTGTTRPRPDPDAAHPKRWHWDPLRDARLGGMGQLAAAVRHRVAPFIGFCGGAQILGLLEARRSDATSPEDDRRLIDQVLRRTSGHPIRGFAPPIDVERAWPTDPHPPRAKIQFLPDDPLFADLSGPLHRSTTQALPESHADAIRPDAFLAGGPLARFDVLATSAFCAQDVVAAGPRDGVFPNPSGPGSCDTVPEAFRSRGRRLADHRRAVPRRAARLRRPRRPAIHPSRSPTRGCSSTRPTSRWSTPTSASRPRELRLASAARSLVGSRSTWTRNN